MLCQRRIVQAIFRRPPVAFSSRTISTSLPRPKYPNSNFAQPIFLRQQLPSRIKPPRRHVRTVTSVAGAAIEKNDRDQLLAIAAQCWPAPPSIPPGWSCTWSEWDQLMKYYWFSPYYLMIPEIEIHVNIQYAVRGETRPILFSNERQSFTFAIVGSSQYFLFDGPHNGLYRIRDVRSDRQLAALLADGDDALIARLEAVEESEEGEDVINRILSRDETVIALLAEKYLDYTPVETTPFMERDHYEFKVTPEMRAESFASASNDVAGRGMALRLERTPEEIEEALLDEEIEAMRKQLKELEDMTKNLTGGAKMNDADVQKMKESLSRMAQDAPKKMHKRRPEDDYVEQNFYVEHKKHDWSPETLEDKKDKYRKLARRADELIKEIRAFPPRDNVGDVTAMLENFTGLRNNMFDYELQSAIEIGEYVVDSLTLYLAAYKVNPESAAKLIST